ncbi:MAG: hypothetical protein EBU93_02970 [Chlamydiae bacterium]|jgi:hypothetical protein|nr:hypothetical protein [Chlamydiota bacterium]
MKLFHSIFCLMVGSIAFLSAETAKVQPIETNQMTSCEELNPQEQAFAANLSSMHRAVFCGCFSKQQRDQAMGYIATSSLNKSTGMSGDMAIEMTLKSCRGMQSMPMDSPMMKQNQEAAQKKVPQAQPKKRASCSKNN